MRLHVTKLLIAFCSIALIGACGDDGSTTAPGADPSTGGAGATPAVGGTLTMGVFGETNGLDPTVSFATGVIGGAELAAIYDTVMRYDPETGAYLPGTAESLTPNADFSVWTLTLKGGIRFTDGTPYDAEAVRYNIERHMADGSRSNYISQVGNNVASMRVIDETTLELTLTSPLASFPYIFTVGPGMIASPTAIELHGEDYGNTVAVGAGPFMLESYQPREELVLTRNPDYFDGPAYLDSVRFVALAGAQATYDALKTGSIDVAFLRDPQVNETARAEQSPNFFENPLSSPLVLAINNGSPVVCRGGQPAPACADVADGSTAPADTPGRDIKVRQAIAHAVDPNVVNERAYGGKGVANNDLFAPGFKWNPDVPANPYDPDRARALVAEAKDAGWNGRIRLTVPTTGADFGQAIAVQLEAVGMEVALDSSLDVAGATNKVAVQRDYDLGNSGYSFGSSDTAYFRLARQLQSDSPGNLLGYRSEEMDAALRALRVAATDAEKTAAYRLVAELFVRDVPALPSVHYSELIAWNGRVHGISQAPDTILLFDKAWVG